MVPESAGPPATAEAQPAFPGAETPDPQAGTGPGQTAEAAFVASRPGRYLLICGVPGHAVGGMYAVLEVSAQASTHPHMSVKWRRGAQMSARLAHEAPAPRDVIRRYIFSQDHKIIGLQYLWTALFMALVGGALAMLIRLHLGWSENGLLDPAQYLAAVTMHGTIMVLFFLTLLPSAFGNFLIPLMIGARDMAFPLVNMLSYQGQGRIRVTTPLLWAVGMLPVMVTGGLTGLFLGDAPSDIYLHDTYWVVGHFHFTMALAALSGAFAGISYWFPKMFGRMLDERLGRIHFALTLPAMYATFIPMHFLGCTG